MRQNKESRRKRYIAFNVEAPREITRGEFITAIKKSTPRGSLGADMAPWLTVFENNQGILRCVHTSSKEATKMLCSISMIGRDRVRVVTLGTSGTIKKAKQRYLAFGDEK